jgi:hypothetical protein
MGKLMLKEQRREVHFGGISENEVLLVRTKNFKSETKNFRSGIGNQSWHQKGEKSFPRQDKEYFRKGGSDAFNSMNRSGHNN